jgi:nucleotide-binding universal stress UspA family protein
MYKNILIPTDGSELASKAVMHGIALAREIGAKVTILFATEPFQILSLAPEMVEYTRATYAEYITKRVKTVLDAAAREANQARVTCETVHAEHGYPYQAIIDSAGAKGCDLIVMASHGRHGVSAIVLGSETVKVLTHSKIPVLVYR